MSESPIKDLNTINGPLPRAGYFLADLEIERELLKKMFGPEPSESSNIDTEYLNPSNEWNEYEEENDVYCRIAAAYFENELRDNPLKSMVKRMTFRAQTFAPKETVHDPNTKRRRVMRMQCFLQRSGERSQLRQNMDLRYDDAMPVEDFIPCLEPILEILRDVLPRYEAREDFCEER